MSKKVTTKNDKWLMFKNYMHNELNITKDDIRQWIQESVEDIAKRMVAKEFNNFDPKYLLNQMIMEKDFWGKPGLKEGINKKVADGILEQIEIKVKSKNKK